MGIPMGSPESISLKKTDFIQISKEKIITIQEKPNYRLRKVLSNRTPHDVFFKAYTKEDCMIGGEIVLIIWTNRSLRE